MTGPSRPFRLKAGDRVKIAKGHYWPLSPFAVVVRKDAILSRNGKRAIGHWYIVRHDGDDEDRLVNAHMIECKVLKEPGYARAAKNGMALPRSVALVRKPRLETAESAATSRRTAMSRMC
jgi:hypothetical protein